MTNRRRNVVPKAAFVTRKANSLSTRSGTDCPPGIDSPTPLFHSPPKIIPILVTNDLYRRCRKVQARCMHNGFPNECSTVGLVGGSKPGSKSLFRNILPVSPCGSIFWQDRGPSPSHKSFGISILEEWGEKKVGDHFTLRPHAGSIALAGQAPSSALALLGTRALPDNLQAAPHSVQGLSHIAAPTTDLPGASKSGAKPLFQNILPVSPCGSIFWHDQAGSPSHKPLEINILERHAKKNERSVHCARELSDKAKS
jgi:hypothetical protein